MRETGCWKSIGLPLAPTEVERRYEPFESGRTRLYTKGILLGYLLYIRRARDGTRTRDPDLGKVVLYQLSHCRIFSVPLTGTIHTILRTKRNVNTFFYFFIINCIHGLYSKNSQNFFIFSLLLKSFQLHIFSHCTSPTSMLYFLCICITQKGVLSL